MSDPAIAAALGGSAHGAPGAACGISLAALAIIALPLIFTDTYWRTNLTMCAINVLLALGLDFILGYTGQLNLGQSAFYGIGAYVSTLLIVKLGVPFWVAFVAGVAFAGLAGMFLSLFAVRLRGHYLAIASLGFAVIIYQILLNWISLTQGPLGIYGIPPPPALTIAGIQSLRLSQLDCFFLSGRRASRFSSTCCSSQLVRSPIGETLTAIREDEVSAASLGINGAAWKVFAFGIGAARRRCRRLLLRELRRHAGAGRVLRHRVLHHPGDGDRRRHGHADRPGVRRDPADAIARAAARHR